jgi:20S proteasome alpha/beta subunit
LHILYSKEGIFNDLYRFGNYFVQPIVAGMENGTPILCSYDSIGAQCMI